MKTINLVTALVLSLLAFPGARAEEPVRPNIVILFADDLGYADLGSYGNPYIRTPNLDRMAAEGQRWTDFYMAAPVCSPSRGALMTGQLPVRSGLYGEVLHVMHPEDTHGMPEALETLPEMLNKAGYVTGMFGKWHLGDDKPHWPSRHGFDVWYGMPYSNDMDYTGADIPLHRLIGKADQAELAASTWTEVVKLFHDPHADYRNWNVPLYFSEGDDDTFRDELLERPVNQTTITRRLTEQAINFMREHADRPFLVYVPYSMPHLPVFASEQFSGKSLRGAYGDAVEELDWSAGEIRKALEDLKLADNTLVLFTSDNGLWQAVSTSRAGSAGVLRGAKGTTWEGGVRVPAIFWGPGIVKPATVSALGSALDILPTAAAMAGVSEHGGDDGYDLSPLLTQSGAGSRTVMPYYARGKLRALRKGNYKLHFLNAVSGEPLETPVLYDLRQDIAEQQDITADNQEIFKELMKAADSLRQSIPLAEPVFDMRLRETEKPR